MDWDKKFDIWKTPKLVGQLIWYYFMGSGLFAFGLGGFTSNTLIMLLLPEQGIHVLSITWEITTIILMALGVWKVHERKKNGLG